MGQRCRETGDGACRTTGMAVAAKLFGELAGTQGHEKTAIEFGLSGALNVADKSQQAMTRFDAQFALTDHGLFDPGRHCHQQNRRVLIQQRRDRCPAELSPADTEQLLGRAVDGAYDVVDIKLKQRIGQQLQQRVAGSGLDLWCFLN